MDDLVQHIVRELSFEGDLGETFVHIIGDCLLLRDFFHHVQVVGVRLSLSPLLFFFRFNQRYFWCDLTPW